MADSTLSPCSPKDEPPNGWAVLLALLAGWGITLRLVVLLCIPIAAAVAIVALIAIYLGPIGVGALLTTASGGYGAKRFLVHHRHRRAARS